jgi:lipoprotein-releasing system permease protein
MSLRFWLAFKYLRSSHTFFNLTTGLAVLGLAFGVAALVVAMAVVSGFEATLTRNVTDMVGHLMIKKRGQPTTVAAPWFRDLTPNLKGFRAKTPFVLSEGILAGARQVTGVVVEGIDPETYSTVMTIEKRVLQGRFDLSFIDGIPGALVGKGLAKRFDLKIGQVFKVVSPVETQGARQFRSKQLTLRLAGVLELGRHEFNERYVVTQISALQRFTDLGDKVMGFRVRLQDHRDAPGVRDALLREYPNEYFVQDYREGNNNLFRAVEIEKVVIFFVLLVIVFVAGFNVSITLFVSVVRRYRDIAILKAMGAQRRFVLLTFALQGLLIGLYGVGLGFLLGLGMCRAFMWAQDRWGLIPAEIYRIDHLVVEVRELDLLVIGLTTLLICFLSSLAPALRGARLNPVEGLKYE